MMSMAGRALSPIIRSFTANEAQFARSGLLRSLSPLTQGTPTALIPGSGVRSFAMNDAQHQNNLVDLEKLKADPNIPLPTPTKHASGMGLDTMYVKHDFSQYPLEDLQKAFDTLPEDPYTLGSGRYKGVSRVKIVDGKLEIQPHDKVFQSAVYNPVAGDIDRNYPHCDDSLTLNPTLQEIIKTIATTANIPPDQEILLHAQRTLSTADATGLPTAEGWHQDGLEVVAIVCVARENIAGGVSYLGLEKGDKVFLEHNLQPGEVLTISDNDCYHYVSPTKVIDPSRPGKRDVIVVVAPSMRPPEPSTEQAA